MSKKSYRRNQNRLYREIKRRIITEQMLLKPMKFSMYERKIETIEVRNIFPNHFAEHIDIVKQDMARRITDELIAKGYVVFHSCDLPIEDASEIRAKLNVCTPAELT